MKNSKLATADLPAGSRRSQPPRLTRNNSQRLSACGAQNQSKKASTAGAPEQIPPIQIFPAITYFADAISALPKEVVRHFTLLKEVDAKIFIPEEELTKLVSDALNTPPPPYSRIFGEQGQDTVEPTSRSKIFGRNSSLVNRRSSIHPTSENDNVWDSANFNRRKLFNQCAMSMQGMLVSLDEKNHVISTAGEALAKQLARIDDCFPFIELEISEEARNGSKTHWAYPENRISKSNGSGTSRKDQVTTNNSYTASQSLGEDASTRSDARKQALLDKRKSRYQHVDSDVNEPAEIKNKEKKSYGNGKVRKVNDTSGRVGVSTKCISISNGNPSKRHKVEKSITNGANSDCSTNLNYVGRSAAVKGGPLSPRSTLQSETSRKRSKPIPSASNGLMSRKRNNVPTSATLSPPLLSPPIATNIAETKKKEKKSLSPMHNGRFSSVRCRQNSIQSNSEKKSVSPSKSMLNCNIETEIKFDTIVTELLVKNTESTLVEDCAVAESQILSETIEKVGFRTAYGAIVSSKGDKSVQQESSEIDPDATNPGLQTSSVTTTKNGRTSKPSTPDVFAFSEPLRSRGIRPSLEIANSRRSHKKGVGLASSKAATKTIGMEDTDKKEDDDNDQDTDEPRYCICNNVSYGEMVACDAEGCKREWFHLACVGLKTAPKGNAKWYCEDCKEITKGKRSGNGR